MIASVPVNHLNRSPERIDTLVEIDRVDPFNPTDTYRGKPWLRSSYND